MKLPDQIPGKTVRPSSYLSPKLEGRRNPGKGRRGVFCRQRVRRGEILAVWGGEIIDWERFASLPPKRRRLALQVEEGLYMFSTREGAADWINHSCRPNAGMRGQAVLVAMRDIAPGEEVCFDYAMSDGSPYDEFECRCGEPECRGVVTGDDWRRPELQLKYSGYFSSYLAKRIEALRAPAGIQLEKRRRF